MNQSPETKTKPWHSLDLKQIYKTLNTAPRGLSSEEAKTRLESWGRNELPKGKQIGAVRMFLRQFKSPLVYILLIAAILTWYIGEYADMTVILIVVIVNAFVGLYQEYRANQIFEKLKQVVKVSALVLRDGELEEIDSELLVPGDIIILKGGGKIPADARLIEVSNLEINESLLTGESKAVEKNLEKSGEKALVGDRTGMVFTGTVVERGQGKAVVAATGAKTEIGKITALTQATSDEESPLQKRVGRLGKFLSELFVVIALAIFLIGIAEGDAVLEMIKTTIAVAVAAIPEGLPAAISIILAVSSQKILGRKGLVRKLIAAETLGSTSVICTDKTGTLTYGQMKVRKILGSDEKAILLNIALANEAIVEKREGKKLVQGEATDKAKLERFLESGETLEKTLNTYPRIALLPFDESRKYLASLHRDGERIRVFTNGAPEAILSHCNIAAKRKAELTRQYENLARQGFRLIAAAEKTIPYQQKEKWSIADMEKEVDGLQFQGLVALRDPIREDVKNTLTLTKRAGIKVLMVTGDHILTARAIGLELGFSTAGNAVILGSEIDKLSDQDLKTRLGTLEVIARVTPEHKMRIIKAWQSMGAVVAMTGDGVNDAPALKAADIGVAVGSGTDVSKEASDLILLDDSFSTITAAIAEGRTGFANIRKATLTVMSNAFAEIVLIIAALVLKTPYLPITAIQILWVNLAEDALPVLAMAFEPMEKGVMKSKPKNPKEPILDRESKMLIFLVSLVSDLTLAGIFFYLLKNAGWDMLYLQTFMFAAIASPTLLNVFAFKSLREPLYKINILNNKLLLASVGIGFALMFAAIYLPALNGFLGTRPLALLPALIAFLVFPSFKLTMVEITKWWYRSHYKE